MHWETFKKALIREERGNRTAEDLLSHDWELKFYTRLESPGQLDYALPGELDQLKEQNSRLSRGMEPLLGMELRRSHHVIT
jgi:hypothetical protein